jgi:uncharacterized protein (TIGR02246 family)
MFVNVVGSYMRGRTEIERQHSTVHAGPYRNSTLQVEVEDARELGPDVIVAHVRTEVRGDDHAPGEIRKALLTLVIERRAGLGRITAAHNTAIVAPAG